MAVSYVDLRSMSPSDFKNAYNNSDEKGLRKYLDYARSVCGDLLRSKPEISDRDYVIEAASNESIIYLYDHLEEYDPKKGAAFSSYFYGAIFYSLKRTLKENGYYNRKEIDGNISAPVQASREIFSKEMIPYIRKWAENLKPLKKRILMARWGFAIWPELSVPGENDSKYGYAPKLARELAESGEIEEKDIDKKANEIRSMLNDILKELRKELPDITGLRPREIRENLYELIVTTKEKEMEKNVRDLIINLDVDTLSDDEAAWLFALILA